MYSEESNAVKMRSFKSFSLRLRLRRFSDGINLSQRFHRMEPKPFLGLPFFELKQRRAFSINHYDAILLVTSILTG
jgi:hypothetical protein